MIDTGNLAGFALIALAMVMTPGPNMIYLVSRTVAQGRSAGLISLAGVALAFLFYMLCTALGITALILAIPFAYDALRIAGALYLLYLAWQAVRPGGRSPFEIRTLAPDSPRKLFAMGFVTNLLNPKAAVLYLSLLPQFIDPTAGNIFGQLMQLGTLQIAISVAFNSLIVIGAGTLAGFLRRKPFWGQVQRWITSTLLASFAFRLAAESRR